ncbi:16S rRNA (guanine(966)-N(2))-methyltransferase RsmD [Shewanella sp. OPT22]|nr:16S rRNA (guanine(966)-N(2))-methyltransferase RsmD [Shewanella sp. OPT22]
MAKNKSASHHIRIISGQWRSRKLPVHDLEGLRPTTDRIKETVFNWLMTDVKNARVLDCFAGSGSLGFEALSRYAQFTQFFELNPQAAKQLTTNLATLNCDNARVSQGDTLSLLEQPPAQGFDLVFIDPPFRKGLVEPVIQQLSEKKWLADDALVYVETESELQHLATPTHWSLLKEKSAGQVTSRLYLVQAVK